MRLEPRERPPGRLLAAAGAGWWFFLRSDPARADVLLHKVKREPLVVSVTEKGTIESADNRDIVCKVRAGSKGYASSINWVIDDGSRVKPGQLLMILDDSDLKDKEDEQTIKVRAAQATKVKAEAEYNKVAAQNKQEGDAFLAKNKSAPGVKVTSSGLQYQVIQAGTSQRPGPNDTVTINYTGTFVNGEKFDSSADHQPAGPAQIPLAAVIPGFREGLQLMQTGGKYKLFIPSKIAYGAQPGNGFPPNETLIFDVTLEKTGPTPAGQQGQGAGG